MTISNVVLDRDKRIVTYDTSELKQIETAVYLASGDCFVADHILHAREINGMLRAMPKAEQAHIPDYYNKTFKGIKLDSYRICQIVGINGGPREHAFKKLMRGTNKGDIETDLELIESLEGILARWKEMIKEDAE